MLSRSIDAQLFVGHLWSAGATMPPSATTTLIGNPGPKPTRSVFTPRDLRAERTDFPTDHDRPLSGRPRPPASDVQPMRFPVACLSCIWQAPQAPPSPATLRPAHRPRCRRTDRIE